MQLGQGPNERQAEARALGTLVGIAGLLERTTQPLQVGGGHADAGVRDDDFEIGADRLERDRYRAVGGREFDRVRQQVEHDLLERPAIGRDLDRLVRQDPGQFDALVIGRQSHEGDPGRDHLAGVEPLDRQRIAVSLDLGHVQHVVDQVEQVATGLMDGVGILGVFVGQRAEQALAHDVGEADHGVQRRAQFVAHVGEEAALAGILTLGLVASRLESQFPGILIGGVEGLDDQAGHRLGGAGCGVVKPAQDQGYAPVQGQTRRKPDGGFGPGQGVVDRGQHGRAVRRVDSGDQSLGKQGIDRQGGRRRAIGRQYAAGRLQHQGQAGLAGQQGLDPGHGRFSRDQTRFGGSPRQAQPETGGGGHHHRRDGGDQGVGCPRAAEPGRDCADPGGETDADQAGPGPLLATQGQADGQGHEDEAGDGTGQPP